MNEPRSRRGVDRRLCRPARPLRRLLRPPRGLAETLLDEEEIAYAWGALALGPSRIRSSSRSTRRAATVSRRRQPGRQPTAGRGRRDRNRNPGRGGGVRGARQAGVRGRPRRIALDRRSGRPQRPSSPAARPRHAGVRVSVLPDRARRGTPRSARVVAVRGTEGPDRAEDAAAGRLAGHRLESSPSSSGRRTRAEVRDLRGAVGPGLVGGRRRSRRGQGDDRAPPGRVRRRRRRRRPPASGERHLPARVPTHVRARPLADGSRTAGRPRIRPPITSPVGRWSSSGLSGYSGAQMFTRLPSSRTSCSRRHHGHARRSENSHVCPSTGASRHGPIPRPSWNGSGSS